MVFAGQSEPGDDANLGSHTRLFGVLKRALADVNSVLPAGQKIVMAADTLLIGDDGSLDSMGLINLIVAIEGEVEKEFGVRMSIADRMLVAAATQAVTLGHVRDLLETELGDAR